MLYKEFKKTEAYIMADVLEIYDSQTGEEFPADYPEDKLDEMQVKGYSMQSGWLSVDLISSSSEESSRIKTVVIEEIRYNDEVFKVGDKVKILLRRGYISGNAAMTYCIGTIDSIYEDRFGMTYDNTSKFFFPKDVTRIERYTEK